MTSSRHTAPPTPDASADVRPTAAPSAAPDPVPTWDEVASDYGPKVYAMAYRLTGDRQEAEDLAQDVFVRVYRNLGEMPRAYTLPATATLLTPDPLGALPIRLPGRLVK